MPAGRPRIFESPDELKKRFIEYVEDRKSKPFYVETATSKGEVVKLAKEKPLTWIGFENWLWEKGICSDLAHYEMNTDDAYKEFLPIVARIKQIIKDDQIAGGMTNVYNSNLTARLNGLSDSTNHTIKDQRKSVSELFPDDLEDGE